MFFEHKSFWLPKSVEHEEEYQDAFAVDEVRGIAAIADGVSSSLFAGSWAKLLAEAAVHDPPDIDDADAMGSWLGEQRDQWREPIDVESLAWHQKPKFEDGAYTTLLWVELASDESGNFPFTCYSIGDCCLFHVRENRVLRGFPFEHSSLFDVRPKMIGSAAKKIGPQLEFDTLDDACQPGDMLALCTDALAVWALMELESGARPDWSALWKMTDADFRQFVLDMRAENKIRFDDTTLVLLKVLGQAETRVSASSSGLADEVKKNVRSFSKLFSAGKPRRKRP